MSTSGTHAQRLAERILGQPIIDWITEHRGEGPKFRSWRLVARDLLQATDGEVDVTGEAVRGWVDTEKAA